MSQKNGSHSLLLRGSLGNSRVVPILMEANYSKYSVRNTVRLWPPVMRNVDLDVAVGQLPHTERRLARHEGIEGAQGR